ncbi:endonuclease/exonuclease/phosphatase family protein [Nocardiopsis mangrovi]|uniref:Endonuclease/exonuclease/phosphatase family protein n=1 Tax=Nocardiopsis mangrovi TaxID=1179818 RepID=A0ABV9E3W8_9ACTN
MISVLTLNIGAAAEPRATRILDWLADRDDQVIALSETSTGPGTALLLDRYTKAGWEVVHTQGASGQRGAAILSRVAIAGGHRPEFAGVSIPGRAVYTLLDTRPRIGVLGLYVPNNKTDGSKQEFITTVLAAVRGLPADQREHLVIAGDYNVIARTHEPRHPGFAAYEYGLLEELEKVGLVDAHTRIHPRDHPHSWVGRTGDGYRYDYVHVGAALAGRLTASAYLHETREGRALTDHSAVAVGLRPDAVRLLETENPAESGAPTLF